MLRPRQLLTYFGHNSLFSFISELIADMCCGGEGGGTHGDGGVSHIGAGIILSASWSLALFCFMFKVVFIVLVHGPEFNRSECMYLIL